MIKIGNFWRSVRLSWLRRLPFSKSTWAQLYKQEIGKFTFNPTNVTMNDRKAKQKNQNPVWRDIYVALLTCRKNVLKIHPEEYLAIPICGEPDLTSNNEDIKQAWCNSMMVYNLLKDDGNWKTEEFTPTGQKPI